MFHSVKLQPAAQFGLFSILVVGALVAAATFAFPDSSPRVVESEAPNPPALAFVERVRDEAAPAPGDPDRNNAEGVASVSAVSETTTSVQAPLVRSEATTTSTSSTTVSPTTSSTATATANAAAPSSSVVTAGNETQTTFALPTTALPTSTTAVPLTSAPSTTEAPVNDLATTPSAVQAPVAPTPRPAGTRGAAGYIAPSAPTYIPVYDTAWQMFVRSTPAQADSYFAALKDNGFSGTWSGIIHHAPATYNLNFAGGGQVANLSDEGEVVLTDAYVAHARQILDAAQRHGMKVGVVAAWQNLYLPGGGADRGVATSDEVRGTITEANAYAYGYQLATAIGDHPAVSMWVFGGDAGTNNTDANKAVWREMARGVRDAGNRLSITYHTPTSEFGQLNYAGEPWLDFISPETGHAQDAATTQAELESVASAYGLPVWQGEPRYFNINFNWVNAAFRNPGVAEVEADAQAAENAGVTGYVYGDAGRWTWCAGFGDSTPCSPNDIAASFGPGERAVIDVFRR